MAGRVDEYAPGVRWRLVGGLSGSESYRIGHGSGRSSEAGTGAVTSRSPVRSGRTG
jgi:hypothetical protein